MKKFKGDSKKLKWYLKNHKKGKFKKDLPIIGGWEIKLAEFFALCSKDNGFCAETLKIIFESNNIKDKRLYYETLIILNRVHIYMR